jgi:hypothetical protein
MAPGVIVRRPDPMQRAVLSRELRRIEPTIAAAATPERRRLVVLVGCVSQKRPPEQDRRGLLRHWPAADLYTSPLFGLCPAYAERHAPDAWAVLDLFIASARGLALSALEHRQLAQMRADRRSTTPESLSA